MATQATYDYLSLVDHDPDYAKPVVSRLRERDKEVRRLAGDVDAGELAQVLRAYERGEASDQDLERAGRRCWKLIQ